MENKLKVAIEVKDNGLFSVKRGGFFRNKQQNSSFLKFSDFFKINVHVPIELIGNLQKKKVEL